MTILDDVIKIQRKYFNNEDITIDLSELLVELKKHEYAIKTYTNDKTRYLLNNTDEVNKVAYFLSLYDHVEISKEQRPTPAIREIAERLNVKFTTLRNKRDLFDAKIKELKIKLKKKSNYLVIREGWKAVNTPLPKKLQQTYDECVNKSHDELLAEVKKILNLN